MLPLVLEKRIFVRPIGFVRTEATGDEVKDKNRLSTIVVKKALTKALDGIGGFSHLYVLFYIDKISDEQKKMLKIHPRGRRDMPLVGVFATRTYLRPNPIGLTLVELIAVKNNVLTVRGLDAFDGTPVLDLKPYDFWDKADSARMPEWWTKMENEKDTKKNKTLQGRQ